MTVKATELSLEFFRGATRAVTMQFDPKKQLVVVFGENGTGKSTIVDAFDMVANNVFGSIESRSSATNRHAPAIGKKPKDVKVVLNLGPSQWKGLLNGSKIEVTPSDTRPKIEILRRNRLLTFVEATPGERYKVLQRFIDVAGVEASEKQALDAFNEANRDNEKAIQRQLTAEEKLSTLWEENGKPGASWLEWAVDKSKLDTDSLASAVTTLESVVSRIHSFEARKTDFKLSQTKLDDASAILTNVDSELRQQQESWSDQTPNLISALESTTSLLDSGWSEESCPVCAQGIKPDALRSKVSTALDSMKALKTANDSYKVAKAAVPRAEQSLRNDTSQMITAITNLLDDAQSSQASPIDALSLDFDTLKSSLQSEPMTPEHLTSAVEVGDQLVGLEAALTQKKEESQRDKNQLHTIKTEYTAYTDADDEIHETNALRKKLEKIHGIVLGLRIKFVQDILDSVSAEVDSLYSIIHPDEDVKSGRLELATNKRASLLQKGEFAGEKDVEPQGYFSDSHLDTLGFCCWWALAKREGAEKKIVILDDVFTSVDAPHLSRILELLDGESGDFGQVLAFTHNRVWIDRYRQSQGASKLTQLVQLTHWKPERGLACFPIELAADEVSQLLHDYSTGVSPLDRQAVASKGGILLEAVLSQLSLQYRCRVPHSAINEYTLADLLNANTDLFKKLSVSSCCPSSDGVSYEELASPKPEFDKLKSNAFVRNQVGCHFNLSGLSLADADVEEFGKAALALVEAVSCGNCGEVPRSDKSHYRQCSCKKTRLTPANLS